MNVKTLLLILSAVLIASEPLHSQAPSPADSPAQPEETPVVVDRSQATGETTPRRSRRSQRAGHKDTVVFGAPINVKVGESVHNIVGIGSPIQIDGTVDGDLVSVLGKVKLGPSARVERDLVVVGASFEADPLAHINHPPVVVSPDIILALTNLFPAEVAFAGKEWVETGLFRVRPLPLPTQSRWAWLVAGASLVLCVLIELLFPKTIRATVTALEEKPGSAFMTGLLTSFLTLPLLLLLTVTVVGIAVIPFAACALIAMFVLGKTSVYHYAGQAFSHRLGQGGLATSVLALILGAAIFYLVYCVPVLGGIVWMMAGLMGVGAVMLTVLGRSRSAATAATVPLAVEAPAGSEAPGAATVAVLPRAGFWIRFLATLLDLVLVSLIVFLAFKRPAWFPLAWLIYHLGFWIWQGTTVGGIICSLRIVRLNGERLTPAAATVRLLGSIFSLAVAGLGFFWAGWSADKQSWHDKIAGTTIVRLSKSPALF